MGACAIGVDLGGTNVRAGVFEENGAAIAEACVRASRAQAGVDATVEAIAETVLEARAASPEAPAGIGIAIPGHVDARAGVVRWAPNFGEDGAGGFRYWKDVPIRGLLSQRLAGAGLDVPIHMNNDANLAALGEYRYGSGGNAARCLVMLTIGTGIGGGVILAPDAVLGDAREPLILVGCNGGGAELGHTVINYQGLDASAGSYGALEAYCQRDGIVRRACHRIKRRPGSILERSVDGDLAQISPRTISEAADQGCDLSLEVWEEVGTMLGVGIGNFINVFAPDVVAIGGQISKAGRHLLDPAVRAARNTAIPSLFQDARIVRAEQVEDAGMLGAAALAFMARAQGVRSG